MDTTVWTMGHSTRPLQTFLELLAHYQLEVVDRRRQCLTSEQRTRKPTMKSSRQIRGIQIGSG